MIHVHWYTIFLLVLDFAIYPGFCCTYKAVSPKVWHFPFLQVCISSWRYKLQKWLGLPTGEFQFIAGSVIHCLRPHLFPFMWKTTMICNGFNFSLVLFFLREVYFIVEINEKNSLSSLLVSCSLFHTSSVRNVSQR